MVFEKIEYVVLDIQGPDPQCEGVNGECCLVTTANIPWHPSAPVNVFVDK